MAKTDDAIPDAPDSAPEDTVGELTDEPFSGNTTPVPPAEDDATQPTDDLPVPDEGEPYDGAFQDAPKKYEDTPGGPVVPPPAVNDDIAAPPPTTGDDSMAKAPTGKVAGDKETRYVDALLLNVRDRPTSRAPIVRRLLGGAKVYVDRTTPGGWARIRPSQWVRTRYLSESPTRKVSRAEADKAWKASKYKDRWKPGKKKK